MKNIVKVMVTFETEGSVLKTPETEGIEDYISSLLQEDCHQYTEWDRFFGITGNEVPEVSAELEYVDTSLW